MKAIQFFIVALDTTNVWMFLILAVFLRKRSLGWTPVIGLVGSALLLAGAFCSQVQRDIHSSLQLNILGAFLLIAFGLTVILKVLRQDQLKRRQA